MTHIPSLVDFCGASENPERCLNKGGTVCPAGCPGVDISSGSISFAVNIPAIKQAEFKAFLDNIRGQISAAYKVPGLSNTEETT